MLKDTGIDWKWPNNVDNYSNLTKRQISLVKQLCSKNYAKVLKKAYDKKNKKDLSFILELCEFCAFRYRSSKEDGRKELYRNMGISMDHLISACFNINKEYISNGSPNWYAPQGVRQSFTYRRNMFIKAVEYTQHSLARGELNIPLVWAIKTPLTVDENQKYASERYSNLASLKLIATNRLEAEQVWTTVLRPCLGINAEYKLSWSDIEFLGLRKYYDISNYGSLSSVKSSLCKRLEDARRQQEKLQKELGQLEINFTMVNSTITMANLSYED